MLNKAIISAGVKQVYTRRCRFWGGALLPRVWHCRGQKCLAPLVFWLLIPTWLQEIRIPD